jgi:hypothetical protein
VDTEATYVKSLDLLNELFIRPLLTSGVPEDTDDFFTAPPGGKLKDSEPTILSPADVRIIFPSIEELLMLHKKEFLPPLLETQEREGKGIGQFFVQKAGYMRVCFPPHQHFSTTFETGFCTLQLYINYLNSYEDGIKRLIELLATNARFTVFVESASRDPRMNNLQLADMLIKPFQRLTKYLLLLRVGFSFLFFISWLFSPFIYFHETFFF